MCTRRAHVKEKPLIPNNEREVSKKWHGMAWHGMA